MVPPSSTDSYPLLWKRIVSPSACFYGSVFCTDFLRGEGEQAYEIRLRILTGFGKESLRAFFTDFATVKACRSTANYAA